MGGLYNGNPFEVLNWESSARFLEVKRESADWDFVILIYAQDWSCYDHSDGRAQRGVYREREKIIRSK